MRLALVLVLRCLCVAALVLAAAPARAQAVAVTGIVGGITRIEPGGASADRDGADPHPGGVPANTVNYEDCAADLSYVFQLSLSGGSAFDLEAWAGTQDCTPYAARWGASPSCWPLTAAPISQRSPPATVFIRAQDLAHAAAATAGVSTYTAAGASACNPRSSTAAVTFTIYFFFVDASKNAIGTAQAYPLTVDTSAQNIEGSVSIAQGDGEVTVAIGAPSDPDTVGWAVYIDPPPGSETAESGIYYDAPSNNGECAAPSSDSATTDTAAPAPGNDASADGAADVAVDGGAPPGDGSLDALDAAVDGSLDDSASDASDAPLEDVADSALVDSATADGPIAEDAAGADSAAPPPTHDGGCAIPSGGVILPAAGCPPSGVLVSGGGTTTWTLQDGGFSEAGTQVLVEAGSTSGGHQSLIPPQYFVTTAPVADTTITVTGLKNGYYYNVGVAAVDGAGNVGPLVVLCGAPFSKPDFFGLYYGAGGRAGGGFCSTEGAGLPAGTTGLGLLMMASVVAMIRKRRRRA